MGTIKTLKNGKFLITVYDLYGKRHRIRFDKHRDANAYINRIEKEKSENKLMALGLYKKIVSIEESINDFMKTKISIRERTTKTYERFYNQFYSFCKAEKVTTINEFRREHADSFYQKLISFNSAPKTINSYLLAVKSLFEYCLNKDIIVINPFSHISLVRNKIKTLIEREEEYYDKNEIKNFFSQNMDSELANVFKILLLTGMRISELANLEWEQGIDLTGKIIKIRSNEKYKTKTATSERDIPMTESAYEIISKLSNKGTTGPVFKIKGRKVKERTLLSKCKAIAEKAMITKNATLHKWRHSFASHLVNAGLNYEERQYLMGHKGETMTDRYTKIDPKNLRERMNELDKLLE